MEREGRLPLLGRLVAGTTNYNVLASPVLHPQHVGVHKVHLAAKKLQLFNLLCAGLIGVDVKHTSPGYKVVLFPAVPEGGALSASWQLLHVALDRGTRGGLVATIQGHGALVLHQLR